MEVAFPDCWHFKVHGNEYQRAGIPDRIFCIKGLFVAIEIKMPGEDPDELQEYEIDQINKAGGIAIVARSPQEAVELVQSAIARATRRR